VSAELRGLAEAVAELDRADDALCKARGDANAAEYRVIQVLVDAKEVNGLRLRREALRWMRTRYKV